MTSRPTLLQPAAYRDPDQHRLERRHLARAWFYLCPEVALSDAGATVAKVICGYPLVAVNDAGTIKGFHNVCRHRAGPLIDDGESTCSRFVCRYHGWAYNLAGELVNARDFGGELQLEEYSLHSAGVATWRGLVFVQPDPTGASFSEWIAPLASGASSFELETFALEHVASHTLLCNWKVYAENYLEGYHIPLVHPGLNRQVDATKYEVLSHEQWCEHRAPTKDGAVTSGAWLWRFPGLALNLYPNGMSIEQFTPAGPHSTVVEYAFFFDPSVDPEERHTAIASSTNILEEDRNICELVQRNLDAGIYTAGVLSPRHEAAVGRFQELIVGLKDLDATTPA